MPRVLPPFVAAATSALALLLLPAVAAADTYTVFGCRGPADALTPAAGWQLAQVGASTVANTCVEGGGLSAALSPDAPGGSVARLRFDAPPATRIVRVGARRKTGGVAKTEQTLDAIYELSTDGAILEKCALAADSSCTADLVDTVDKQGLDAAWVRFSVVCSKGGDERCARAIRVDADQVAIGLKDSTAPVVGSVDVLDDGDRSGILRIRFDAADSGGGVYRALVKVDGTVMAVAPLGGGDCADADPADADPDEVLVPVPCPPIATRVPIAIAAGDLSPGPHTLQVDVEDAAGNSTAAYVTQFPRLNAVTSTSSTSTIAGQVAQLLKARLTVRFDRNKKTALTNRFGRRVVIRGFLRTRSGRGIQGARIDVYHLVGGKRRSLSKTGLKTRARGALTLILPLDLDTRQIRFTYRALRPGPVTSRASLRLTVRDGLGQLVQRVR
jgi:hypothetical protein